MPDEKRMKEKRVGLASSSVSSCQMIHLKFTQPCGLMTAGGRPIEEMKIDKQVSAV
jgi:hypothetical protein